MDENTLRVDESQVQQDLEQSEIAEDLYQELEYLNRQLKSLDIKYQVWMTTNSEVLSYA